MFTVFDPVRNKYLDIDTPSDLPKLGHPLAPRQPIHQWPTIRDRFRDLCSKVQSRNDTEAMAAALGFAVANYVTVRMVDVPEGVREHFVNYVREGDGYAHHEPALSGSCWYALRNNTQ